MADTEEPQFNTLAERIAALNKQKNFNSNDEPVKKRPPPPAPPVRPLNETRAFTAPALATTVPSPQTTPTIPSRPVNANRPPPLPRRDTQNSLSETPKPAPPPLPSRTPSSQSVPIIGSRTPTLSVNHFEGRRGSTSSDLSLRSTISSSSVGYPISSTTSNGSTGTRHKVAPAFDPATLPPLPPSKREAEAKAKEAAKTVPVRPRKQLISAKSTSSLRQTQSNTVTPPPVPIIPAATSTAAAPPKPKLPPRLPSRPQQSTPPPTNGVALIPQQPPRQPPRQPQHQQQHQQQRPTPQQPPQLPQRQETRRALPPPATVKADDDDAPPPVPLASRPSFAQIEASSTRAVAPVQPGNDCWTCRDWSEPDGVAAQFPRDSLPRRDPVGHLARGLCDPFPSYTDKARAIFTWFHHNIWYDTVAFFGNNVKHMSVEDTIFSGKAVCQGYAETYKAIANRAGLDCELVSGHGKGYGHTPLKKGESPPPPKPSGHAWNAVRVDGGVWKLLDACWGAGHLDSSTGQYKQKFTPEQFTRSNDQFGMRHFPRESKFQFRDDGRVMSWEEYFVGRVNGETPTIFTNAHQEGIAEDSVEPKEKQIPVYSGEVVRFQFSKICEHWKPEIHGLGKPPLLLMSIHGVDGRKDEMIPIETDGYWHWIDINARDLGAPGQSVQVSALTSIGGQDGRGVSGREFLSKKGKVGMSWSGVIKWDLV